jgi:hypothetical protein
MTERSGYVLEILREGREFTVYRGRQRGNPLPVLAVALAAERPSPQSLRRHDRPRVSTQRAELLRPLGRSR